jgi:hypothetical protein
LYYKETLLSWKAGAIKNAALIMDGISVLFR